MKYFILIISGTIFLASCVKDDFIDDRVDPVLRISNAPDTIAIDTLYQFQYTYRNNIGIEEEIDVNWSSSNDAIFSIDQNGLCTPQGIGSAYVKIDAVTNELVDSALVHIGNETVIPTTERTGSLNTTTFYTLEGDFVLREDGDNLILEFAENYEASSSLPGLYVYLTNNPNTTSGAYEIGAVSVFSGEHSYSISGVDINEYDYILYFCAPFNVKVGDGQFEN
ncbi:MAG: hypothetical protein AAF487_08955 [Bacteroidota bacterium]